jgi:hypothetical protein
VCGPIGLSGESQLLPVVIAVLFTLGCNSRSVCADMEAAEASATEKPQPGVQRGRVMRQGTLET